MKKRGFAWLLGVALLAGCASPLPQAADATAQVRAAETAFAKSMADRDFAAFSALVADDAVFINGGQPLRGKAAILAFWKKFFDGPAAPFAWRPEIVEASGAIGYTDEYDVGLYLKRALVLSTWLGTATQHRARYADLTLAEAS